VSRLDSARAALLASGRKESEHLVREAICRDLGADPADFASAKVRVECAQGHLVANVTVLAVDIWPGITILPPIEPEHVGDAAYGLAYEIRQNWAGDIGQFQGRVRVTCKVSRCGYRGSKAEDMLAAELAEAAVARHAARLID
jgi:hypothetical protein